jgi:hypothetical protein
MPEWADLVIEGTFITMDPDRRLIRDGGVAVNGSNYQQIDSRSTYEDAPGALGEDVAVTDEWLARWSGEGQGRLRPCIHNTVIRAGRLVSRTRVVTDENPDRSRGVEQSIAEGEACA